MTALIRERAAPRSEARPQFTRVGDDVVIGSATWLGAEGRSRERFEVITLRGGEIADMQGCRSRREAERLARRRLRQLA